MPLLTLMALGILDNSTWWDSEMSVTEWYLNWKITFPNDT